MTDIDPTRLDRIRKLLSKAERAGTPDEAEIYTEKAVALMARHGIDDAMIAAGRPASADPIGGVRITIDDPYSGGKARLLGWTAAASGCRWLMHDVRGARVAAVTVFGHRSDRERIELLYTSLLLQVARPLRDLRPPDPRESVAAFRRSWLYGYAARVHERLSAQRERATAEHDARAGDGAPGAALVLADRSAAVDTAFGQEFAGLRRARRPTTSGTGWSQGVAAADRADLGQARVGGERRAVR